MDVHECEAGVFWKLAARLVRIYPVSYCIERANAPIFFFLSSQAMDVGTLKSVQAESIRIIVWILSFMSFGYATGEFEVTSERLGVYRPEEHIE